MYSLIFENDSYQGLYLEVTIICGVDIMVFLCEKISDKKESICKIEIFTIIEAMQLANRLEVPLEIIS